MFLLFRSFTQDPQDHNYNQLQNNSRINSRPNSLLILFKNREKSSQKDCRVLHTWGQKFTCTQLGHECHGNIGLLLISFSVIFFVAE